MGGFITDFKVAAVSQLLPEPSECFVLLQFCTPTRPLWPQSRTQPNFPGERLMMSYKEGPTLRIDLSNMGTLEESDRTVLISVPIAVQRGKSYQTQS